MLHKTKMITAYYYFAFCAIWLETLLKKYRNLYCCRALVQDCTFFLKNIKISTVVESSEGIYFALS